jgi:hypothetical protein
MHNRIDEYAGNISLANLINGFKEYIRTIGVILRNVTSYPNTLSEDDNVEFPKAIKFITYAVCISFFIMIPIFAAHQESLTKLLFFIRLLTNYLVWGLLLHFSLVLFGSRGVILKRTFTIYAYIMGIGLPLYLIIALPLLIMIGPMSVFGGAEESIAFSAEIRRNIGLFFYIQIVFLVIGILGWVVMLSWLSKSHRMGKLKVFFALIFGSIIGGFFQLFILNPAFNSIYSIIDYWFGLVF